MTRVLDLTRRSFVKRAVGAAGATVLLRDAEAADAAAPPAQGMWPSEQVLADFDELYPRLRAAHYDLYARRPRAEYDLKFKNMRRHFEQPLAKERVLIEFQRFMAYGRVAHGYCGEYWSPFQKYMAAGGKQFPLALKIVGGKAYVTANHGTDSDVAVGDELTRVNRQSFAQLRRRLHAYLSADNEYLADTLLEQQVPMAIWFELGSIERFEVEVRAVGRSARRATLQAVTGSEVDKHQALHKPASATDWNQRTWKMLADGLGYLRPGPFYNHEGGAELMYDTTAFARFIDEAFHVLRRAAELISTP